MNIGSIKFLPINLFGTVMSIAGLALVWRAFNQMFGFEHIIPDLISAIAIIDFMVLIIFYTLKWVKYPAAVRQEFNHPIVGNFFGTVAIATLLIAMVLAPYSQILNWVFWIIGTILTLILGFVFVNRFFSGNLDRSHIVPAWLIPGVASLDIAVAGGKIPFAWAEELNLFALAIGTFVAIIFFIIIASRLAKHDPLPKLTAPSLMIMIAPFAVGFLGYTSYTQNIDKFAGMLFYFSLFMFFVISYKLYKQKSPFSVFWWAIGFPIAALTNASFKYAAFANTLPLKIISIILLIILTLSVAVLFVKTIRILLKGELLKAA